MNSTDIKELLKLVGTSLIIMGITMILLNGFILFAQSPYKWLIIGGLAGLGMIMLITGIFFVKGKIPFVKTENEDQE